MVPKMLDMRVPGRLSKEEEEEEEEVAFLWPQWSCNNIMPQGDTALYIIETAMQ